MRILFKLFLVAAVLFAAFLLLTIYAPKTAIERDGGYRLKCEVLFQGEPWAMNVAEQDVELLTEIIDKRLRALGYRHGAIKVGAITEIEIPRAKEEEADLIRRSLERVGLLRFQLVADEASGLKRTDIEKEILRIYQMKKAGADLSELHYDLILDSEQLDRMSLAESSINSENASQCFVLGEKPSLPGDIVRKSYRAEDSMGRPSLGIDFSQEGSRQIHALTSKNLNRHLAIVLDGKLLQSAMIRGAITNKAVIDGSLDGDIRSITVALNGGAFPYGLSLVQKEAVYVSRTESSGRGRFIAMVSGAAFLLILIILLFPKRKSLEQVDNQ